MPVDAWSLAAGAVTLVAILVATVIFWLRRGSAAPARPEVKARELDRANPVGAGTSTAPAKVAKGARSKTGVADKTSPLLLSSLKGQSDVVRSVAFSATGAGLATACGDTVVRVYKVEDMSSKSHQVIRVNLDEIGVGASFGDSSKLMVATEAPSGATNMFMYSYSESKATGEKAPISMVWKFAEVHTSGKSVLSLSSSPISAAGLGMAASCSDGTDICVISSSGKQVARVDTNQLRNHMAALSPNGRFLAAAAFTADVKIWELGWKDGGPQPATRVMQLKGHKSAVTCLRFARDGSDRMVSASKDGTWRVWSLAVRYWLDEDPKCVLNTQYTMEEGQHYSLLDMAPSGVVAACFGSTLHFLCGKTGRLLETVEHAHGGRITCLEFSPIEYDVAGEKISVLATGGVDKAVKLWRAPK